jgi:serine/threonine-protein kinase
VPARAEPGPVPVGTQRVIGATLGGIGVIGLVVAAVFAGEAKTKDGQAADHCDGTRCRDPLGASLSTDARTAGDVATVAFVAGAGALAAGAIVFFTAPSRPSGASPVKTGALRSLRLAPRIGLASGGLDLGGAW